MLFNEILLFREECVKHNNEILKNGKNMEKIVEVRPWSDMLIIVGIICTTYFVRKFLNMMTVAWSIKAVSKNGYPTDHPEHKWQLNRFMHYQWSWIFYGFTFWYALYICWDHPYITKWIGGSSEDMYLVFETWPYYTTTIPYVRPYIMIQLGVHLYSTITHLLSGDKVKNFSEISFHHCITCTLVFYAYYMNEIFYSMTVFLAYDFGDCMLTFAKWLRDAKSHEWPHWTFSLVYLKLCIIWGYGRVFFPIFNYLQVMNVVLFHFKDSKDNVFRYNGDKWYFGHIFMVIMSYALTILNAYWFKRMIDIGYQSLGSGKKFASTHEGEIDINDSAATYEVKEKTE